MEFKKVTLIGGGVLGSQIAYQAAYKGFDVSVYLRSDASVERFASMNSRLPMRTSSMHLISAESLSAALTIFWSLASVGEMISSYSPLISSGSRERRRSSAICSISL